MEIPELVILAREHWSGVAAKVSLSCPESYLNVLKQSKEILIIAQRNKKCFIALFEMRNEVSEIKRSCCYLKHLKSSLRVSYCKT